MRAVIQRVKCASVSVDDSIVGEIEGGLLVFMAVTDSDTDADLQYLVDKTVGLRIFKDDNDKMNLSIEDFGGEILVISQFTLYGDARKGRRPSFVGSAGADKAREYYQRYIQSLKEFGFYVESGIFGAHMEVSLINDGPVTIQLDSSKLY